MTEPTASERTPEMEAANDQMMAGQIITACNAALNVFRIHAADNKAVEQPLRSITSGLETLTARHAKVMIACVEGVFYLGDSRIRMSSTQQLIADQLASELDRRAVGGIAFDGVPQTRELVRFFQVLSESKGQAASADPIRQALRQVGVGNVTVSRVLKPITEDEHTRTSTDRAADVYAAAIKHAANLFGGKGGLEIRSARSKRIVHELVDLAESDGYVMLSLAGLRDTGHDEAEHAVAVTVLSVALGRRLGLSKNTQADLGVAAMHHDAGLMLLGPNEQHDMARHPVLTLKSLFGSTTLDERILRQVIVGFEHHLDYAGGGHPELKAEHIAIHPLAQIVRLGNDFDGLTRGRRGGRPLDVMEALDAMAEHRGKHYQPELFSIFYEMVGGVEDPSLADDFDLLEGEPAPRSELDAMLADFLEEEPESAPEPAPQDDLDAMLADFLGDGAPPKVEAAAPPKPKPAPKAKPKPKGKALGALKLKRVKKKR